MNKGVIEAKEFIDELELPIPVDLYKICETLNIEIIKTKFDDAYGYLYVGKGKKIIFINDNISSTERERFTIAHELGHYILGHKMKGFYKYTESDYNIRNINNEKEKEADSFASELLMPSKYIKDELENIIPKDYNLIMDLKNKYKVSLSSLLCRYIDFSYESLVLIYFKNSKELWRYQNYKTCKFSIIKNNIKYEKNIIYRKDYLNIWIDEHEITTYELVIPQGEYTALLLHFI